MSDSSHGGGIKVGDDRDPTVSLDGCERIAIVGRTGSGKTTLGRLLASVMDTPHIELDSLYFEPDFSTVSAPILRERTAEAVAGDRWVTDGNKKAVRDLVWAKADTIVWLDYPVAVSLWRLAGRAVTRANTLQVEAAQTGDRKRLPRLLLAAARGVLRALRSHRGQRREYPALFSSSQYQHLTVVRLRSPRATSRWLKRVAN